jgi:hypothetical protein
MDRWTRLALLVLQLACGGLSVSQTGCTSQTAIVIVAIDAGALGGDSSSIHPDVIVAVPDAQPLLDVVAAPDAQNLFDMVAGADSVRLVDVLGVSDTLGLPTPPGHHLTLRSRMSPGARPRPRWPAPETRHRPDP